METREPFLDAEKLRAATFVRYIEIHDTLGSTNDRAKDLARETNIQLPALVVARQQTAGKGRGQNKWWSADGALTFSVLLDPAAHGIISAKWPQLSLTTAVAICDVLQREALGLAVAIKWPNDVMIDGRKVCGVLIESPSGTLPTKNRLIIGIGINVNNSWRSAPRDFGPNGTALCDVTGMRHDLQYVLIGTLREMNERFLQLARSDSRLPDTWQKHCWLTEQDVDVHAGDRWFTGVCLGIDSDGALIVDDKNGVHRIRSGSVRVV